MRVGATTPAFPTISRASGSTSPSRESAQPRGRDIPDQAPTEIDESGLTTEEKQELEALERTDRKVRAHEQAHQAAAGQYAIGGPTFQYETGPDGQRYAVGGEVKLDVSKIPDAPEATIRKMQQVRRAALAPRDPSGQDRRVAAEAGHKAVEARREAAEKRREELQGRGNYSPSSVTAERDVGSTNPPPDSPLIDVVV